MKKAQYTDTELNNTMNSILGVPKDELFTRMALSIAPEIHGMEDVKKALLLQLIGGTSVSYNDGVRVRGDINILLMGDPGIAKSQLLKSACSISPRGVYTTGKGSSGVGLTACVVRDPINQEFMLEGGALVMADKGLCCIDEFDKMEEMDRTALHEAMEQQSVSIAKAGITTALNSRCGILAAANPLYGRYNTKISAFANLDLPTALLSRFDLIFILIDKFDSNKDKKLAEHVTYVHAHGEAKENSSIFPIPFIRAYIRDCREKEPKIQAELMDYISNR